MCALVTGVQTCALSCLGTWSVLAEEGHGANEFHVVYASPGTVDTFQKSGQFSDDAVLVKEVYEAATGQMTTGRVGYAETLKGWFVIDRKSTRLNSSH